MIGAIIGKTLSPFMPYILGGAAVAVLTLGGLYYWKSSQYDKLATDAAAKIERVEHNNVLLKDTLAAQEAAVIALENNAAIDRANAEERNKELIRLQTSLDQERQQNDDYKRRWEAIALKKPNLLSNRINRATLERVQFFTSATCRADCDQDGHQDSGGEATTEAKPDRPD